MDNSAYCRETGNRSWDEMEKHLQHGRILHARAVFGSLMLIVKWVCHPFGKPHDYAVRSHNVKYSQ